MTQQKPSVRKSSGSQRILLILQDGYVPLGAREAAVRQLLAGVIGITVKLSLVMKLGVSIPTILKWLDNEQQNLLTPQLISLLIIWDEPKPPTLELSYAWVET